MRPIRILVFTLAAAVVASASSAQSDVAPRSAVSFSGGVSSTSSATGAALGGSWLFDVNDHASIEVQGSYFDRGAGTDALSVGGSLLVNLLSRSERIVPYAAVGGGAYRLSFDLGNGAMLGATGSQFGPGSVICPAPGTAMGQGPGPGFGPGTGTCPSNASGYWGVGAMPAFYARRFGPMTVPPGGMWDGRSFVDPAVSIGGGVRFNVTERVMVRPDVRALMVFADGETHTLGVFGVQLGFRF